MAVSSVFIGVLSLIAFAVICAVASYFYKRYHRTRRQFRREGRHWYGGRRGGDLEHGLMPRETWYEMQDFIGNSNSKTAPQELLQSAAQQYPRPQSQLQQPISLRSQGTPDLLREQDKLEEQYAYAADFALDEHEDKGEAPRAYPANPTAVPRRKAVAMPMKPLPVKVRGESHSQSCGRC
ncbi:hypothetical protein MPH_11737 [Macrophomina phaseolina MS6]|uniref:Uncharacterized protein n=1 Tax=Macrophomina phaseolina (strain MS6) TaxID=1126212 RepID=K2RLU2_MACPH|nr:hypothetical protein MPH_11737 [Macrophomina phaseolina MS6]